MGVLEHDAQMRDVMRQQDCLFTLVVRHPDGLPRAPGRGLGPGVPLRTRRFARILERLVDPAVRIVTLTVTEGGYLKNPATGDFDAGNHAWPTTRKSRDPRTAFAYIVEATATATGRRRGAVHGAVVRQPPGQR